MYVCSSFHEKDFDSYFPSSYLFAEKNNLGWASALKVVVTMYLKA